MERDEAQLVRGILDGDVELFRAIVERHQTRIFYLGLKFLKRFEDAEDFAQEVFLRAFEKLGTFKGDGPFVAWLYRIAYNLGVSKYRLRGRLITEELPQETADSPDRGGTPGGVGTGGSRVPPGTMQATDVERSLIEAESEQQVRAALCELPDRYALIVKMHYYDGLTYGQISEALDMPVNTIKSHILRAKRAIRRRLSGYMEG